MHFFITSPNLKLFSEKYQKMESEKKTRRTVKRVCIGPMIQYRSTRMPIIEEIEIVANKEELKEEEAKIPDHEKYYERTFISILNDPKDIEYNNIFKVKPPPKLPKKLRCAITK